MGILDWLFKNKDYSDPNEYTLPSSRVIPKELFVEENKLEQDVMGNSQNHVLTIENVFALLSTDFEAKGYSDALANPDEGYRTESLRLIKLDLELLIKRVSSQYDDRITEIEFHIKSREKAGLIDIVQELEMEKSKIISHLEKMNEISSDIRSENGVSSRFITSYNHGFNKGLAALTHAKVLNKRG